MRTSISGWSPRSTDAPRPTRTAYVAAGIVLLLVFFAGLFLYKWGGSMRTISNPWSLAPKPNVLTASGFIAASLSYFKIIWPALVFGLLIGATVRAFISPRWVVSLLGGGAKGQLVGGLAGAPLMLCSCCVTPVFTGVYERGARLGPSLAVMLASPGLNVAALVLTFMLFPVGTSAARLAATVVAVFVLSAVLGRIFGDVRRASSETSCPSDQPARTAGDFAARFLRSLGYMTAVTVPLIVAGVLLSSLILPVSLQLSAGGSILAIGFIALVGVLVALPTFFEIPLAMILLYSGAPAGAAVALLFAGPIINLPSLFVLARETGAKVALTLGGGIWLLATVAGICVS